MTRSLYILFFLSIAVSSTSAQGVWTWLHGDSVTQYSGQVSSVHTTTRGTKGIASISNLPPRSLHSGINWKDATDKFWVLGGFAGNNTDTPEVWSYDYRSNLWTWEAGYDTLYIDGTLPDSFKTNLRMKLAHERFLLPNWTDSIGNLWYYNNIVSLNGIFCNLVIKFEIGSKRFKVID